MTKAKQIQRAAVYTVPGSNATRAARLMLEHKGVAYKLITLPNVLCGPLLRAMGFPGLTTPAIKLDGKKLQGSRAIARALDAMIPSPALFPTDPELRARVEAAERWGEEVLQAVPRRVTFSTAVRKGARADYTSFFEGWVLGLPPRLAMAVGGPLLALTARRNRAFNDVVRADLEALPKLLDHVDALLSDGTIGGERLNAADFQIAASVRLLMCLEDLRPCIERHPAARFAQRVAPSFPGHVRAVLPPEWLAPLRESPTLR